MTDRVSSSLQHVCMRLDKRISKYDRKCPHFLCTFSPKKKTTTEVTFSSKKKEAGNPSVVVLSSSAFHVIRLHLRFQSGGVNVPV